MLILKALQRDAMHGFGLSQRIRAMSRDVFQVEMGSLYPALCRLEARGWIKGAWGVSDANRKARFYSLTAAGRRQLREEADKWAVLSSTISLMLKAT
jgi:transcriptional regulator